MRDRAFEHVVIAFLLVVILTQAAFAAFPGIDMAFSGIFADGAAGFPSAGGPLATVNSVLRRTAEGLALALVFWCLYGGLSGLLRRDQLRAWVFAALNVLLASGWVVNLLLKTHVGRARPADISAFGGDALFTPAWQVTDQCADNCSFTSGEVSLATSLILPAVILLWPRLTTPRARRLAIVAATAFVGGVALLRIGLGRHFLSDAVFSVLISTGVVLVLYLLLRIHEVVRAFDLMLPFRAAARGLRKGRLWTRAWLRRVT